MTNPFDDEDGLFFVLVNGEGQHSLWPEFATIPAGWENVFGPGPREILLWITSKLIWTDMRPNSLITSMNRESAP